MDATSVGAAVSAIGLLYGGNATCKAAVAKAARVNNPKLFQVWTDEQMWEYLELNRAWVRPRCVPPTT